MKDNEKGFLNTFLSKGLKTNQLEVNTDEKTLRPIARLKEPRDLFALPKERDVDCSQQAPRWPIECQVIEERIKHIPNISPQPEPFYEPTGNELKPNPVGEENGIVVFNYYPISAVNYEKTKKSRSKTHIADDSSDSDVSSCESSPEVTHIMGGDKKDQRTITKLLNTLEQRSSSNSNEEDDDDDDEDDDDEDDEDTEEEKMHDCESEDTDKDGKQEVKKQKRKKPVTEEEQQPPPVITEEEIDNIWADKSPEYMAATPNYIKNQIDKNVKAQAIPPFSRSAVGGAKFLTNCHPYNPEEYNGLEFESRFESGNLAKAIQITPTYYELYLRPDLYTSRSKQWFYFRVKRTKKNRVYRFSIVNLIKSDSLYNEGMRPVMYSTITAKTKNIGWKRCGDNICYYRNDDESEPSEDDEDNSSYTLTFNIEFEYDNDTVFFAHSFPYTYSDLQDYLMEIQKHPIKSKYCKLRLLCRTLAGNNVYYLTVTTPVANDELMKRKKAIVISARVHPSETPSSWMMKGLMDFITGDSIAAKRLRHKFIFKLIPMLNPDGVIVGNTRNSLTGKDLNRQYRTVIRETYPSIWYTKALIKRLIDDCGVSMYCDMHAHSRRHNIFIYGCENRRNPEKKLTEQVFPLMLHKNAADKFSFENCKFKVQRSKEGTGRIVVWMLGITNSYTLEASFGGSLLGSRKNTHFTTADYEHMGRGFCETLLDYCDENPNKVKRNAKLLKRIKKIRKREKREQKALKLKKMADQECLRLKIIERLLKEGSSAEDPINIQLSDYSSDEGSSSSSDNEGKNSTKEFSNLEGLCCHPVLKVPPCTPELDIEVRKFRYGRMRKVMQELDRIYFQPLFHKKCQFLIKAKRGTFRRRKRRLNKLAALQKSSESFQKSTELCPLGTTPESQEPPKRECNTVTLRYVNENNNNKNKNVPHVSSCSSTTTVVQKRPSQTFGISQNSKIIGRKRLKGGGGGGGSGGGGSSQEPTNKKPLVKVSRKLRLWLTKRQIYIVRRKLPSKIKYRLRSIPRRKKEERLLLDMPTTDPGSDLLFSTDDEYVDCYTSAYGTMPRIRRNLLKSDLQRRYIEEIGDGLRNMPPELIITSPSNKAKQKHNLRITYKPGVDRYDRKPQTANELPYIGGMQQPAKRTSSWHNLNAGGQSSPTKNRLQSPFYRALIKKDPLVKEDLDIKLSLKKKIWTGMQPDEILTVDRNIPLPWMAPAILKGNKEKLTALNGAQAYTKRSETEAFLTACSKKLMEWQMTNSNLNSPSFNQKATMPSNVIAPTIAEDQAMRLYKNLVANIKKSNTTNPSTNSDTDNNNRTRPKRTTISKIADTSKTLAKVLKSKSRNSLATTNRSIAKPTVKSQTRINKFKTSGIVVTAVQKGVTRREVGGAATKKNSKTKSSQQKLQNASLTKANNNNNNNGGENRRSSTHKSGSISSNNEGGGLAMALTASTIARKVKTKLKKHKSDSTTQNTNNFIAVYNKN